MTDRRDWFQIISHVAIIVGLGLVIYELNQSKRFAYVQFFNEGTQHFAFGPDGDVYVGGTSTDVALIHDLTPRISHANQIAISVKRLNASQT